MLLNLFLFYQVVRLSGRKSVNKYLYLYLYLYQLSHRPAAVHDWLIASSMTCRCRPDHAAITRRFMQVSNAISQLLQKPI